ncbi:hypothetical protein SCLCIDRAFT_1224706 [Scleroderma citrinum Foug A]|uniref:Uncharacterized protein n=1 Tax=Scleroderma citrinum Foug A TaxID=1036808 RepID=A0A0C3D568_9AGAM|nr:hypothetical protein SCLCIDRAFT_1224706 [Scleroderma citrinum Foug A]
MSHVRVARFEEYIVSGYQTGKYDVSCTFQLHCANIKKLAHCGSCIIRGDCEATYQNSVSTV